jgi:hypothetical protein
MRFVLLFGLALSVAGPASAQQPDETLPFETIVKYLDGGPLELAFSQTVFIVADRQEWKRVWKLAHSRGPVRPPLPEIDFDNRIVFAVFGGFCNGSITKIMKTEEGLRVLVRDVCPGRNCPSPAGIVTPVQIVETERVQRKIRRKGAQLTVTREVVDCPSS